jgi:hypothetical protein
MIMKSKRAFMLCLAGTLALSGCVREDVEFSGKSAIDSDGNISRSGKLTIVLSGERDVDKDLSQALRYYHENFVPPDEKMFSVKQTFSDSVLTLLWTGDVTQDDFPLSDYKHRSNTGPQAGNVMMLEMKNRWFYKIWNYSEIFYDPVDTAGVLPLLESELTKATDRILGLDSMMGLRDRQGAEALLGSIETETGVNLLRSFLENPEALDSLSDLYESTIETVADSLAGFAGVKLDPDSLTSLLSSAYDAVWDTIFSDRPGIFGSYGLEEPEKHNFRIEVDYPGCLITSNADSMVAAACIWSFDRLDFFAREKKLEIAYRIWSWGNVVITGVVVLILMVFALISLRKKRA